MDSPCRGGRDYLAGSLLVVHSLRSMEWFFKTAAHLSERVAAWTGVQGAFRQAGLLRTLGAILAAAILANGFALCLVRKEIVLWGMILRWVGLAIALLGLFCGSDWPSVRESSLLIRLRRRWGPR